MGSKCLFTQSDNEKEITLGPAYDEFGDYEGQTITKIIFSREKKKPLPNDINVADIWCKTHLFSLSVKKTFVVYFSGK